jgi:hypothetical protein
LIATFDGDRHVRATLLLAEAAGDDAPRHIGG